MSLKRELETQAAALAAYDNRELEKAIEIFQTIADTSKIHTNIGLIYATLGEHELAVDAFNAATELDQYLAIAYFQCGVSNFLLGRFDYALKDFEEALAYLRSNQNIDYEQLGLNFKLYSAEVLFNKGLCRIYLGDQRGLDDMREASREKVTPEHVVIDEAIRDKGDQYTVFSIPVGILFRPSEMKLKNAKAKDYMGKAKLISATDASDAFTTFTGATRLNQGQFPSGAPLTNDLNRANSSPTTRSAPAALEAKASDDNFRGESRNLRANKDIPTVVGGRNTSSDRRIPERSATITTGSSVGNRAPVRTLSLRTVSPSRPHELRPTNGFSLARKVSHLTMRDRDAQPRPAGPKFAEEHDSKLSSSSVPILSKIDTTPHVTEIYDGYLEEYTNDERTSRGTGSPSRPQAWIRKATTSLPPSPEGFSTGASRTPFSVIGGSLRRKLSTKPTGSVSRDRNRANDEDEEGYASGDYEDVDHQFLKILIKIHYQDDTRGMTLTSDMPFKIFVAKVAAKFGASPSAIALKFKDEDGERVSLLDDSDFDLALETARASAKGKPEGKLEVWCLDA